MQILNERPPIYDAILANGMHPHDGVIYAYGDIIYNPSGIAISQDLIEHEQTHSKQQGNDPDAWWGRYLIDPYFRIEQEAEAYAIQYKFLCTAIKDRNQRFRILMSIASILSGPLYGSVIKRDAAFRIVKSKV